MWKTHVPVRYGSNIIWLREKKENKDESQNASVKVLMGLQIGSSI